MCEVDEEKVSFRMFFVSLILFFFPFGVEGHGRLIEPPSRASAWRYGFNTPPDYNDHESFCGGFTRQWVKNEGKCGVCGDPWDSKIPRSHEYGGAFGQGVIVRNYDVGGAVIIRVELTASHNGFFEFALCENFKNTTQECLDKNILKLVKPQENVDHEGYKYFPKDGSKIYEMKYKLPPIHCQHCVLQWRYIAGNNWGNCPNGTGAVGCGPQEEFRACADVSIGEKGPIHRPETEPPTTMSPTLPTPEDTYSPLTTILISVFTFLVISLILFLLYFHYYQLGRQIKSWADEMWNKTGSKKDAEGGGDKTPVPPPRVKRSRSLTESGMHEIDLSGVSAP